jgi:hypothetical protein
VRPTTSSLLLALGLGVSHGTHADKGDDANSGSFGHSHGSQFFAVGGPGPLNAFEAHTQLARSSSFQSESPTVTPRPGGLEFTAVRPPARGRPKPVPSAGDADLAFAPWKVTDKDGRPAGKLRPNCRK